MTKVLSPTPSSASPLTSAVFSGLHRFGYSSAATILTTTPDISVYAKILTGGLLPLSATLASKSIFDAFLSDRKVDALLHGHSYTANPIGCAVALKAVEIVEEHEEKSGWMEEKAMWGVSGASPQADEREVDRGRWSFWDPEFVRDVSMVKGVKGSMAMGTVLAIELDDGEGGKSSLTGVPTQSSNASNRLLVACGLDLPDGVEEGGDQVGLSRLRAIPDPFPTAGERSLPHHEPVYEAGGDEGDGGGH
jgi:hypothetical protein